MELIINKSGINVNLIKLKGINFVYYLMIENTCVYVGSSMNIYKRLKDHKFDKEFDSVKLVSFDSLLNCKRFERYEISNLRPVLNSFCKCEFVEPDIKGIKISIEDMIKQTAILNRN